MKIKNYKIADKQIYVELEDGSKETFDLNADAQKYTYSECKYLLTKRSGISDKTEIDKFLKEIENEFEPYHYYLPETEKEFVNWMKAHGYEWRYAGEYPEEEHYVLISTDFDEIKQIAKLIHGRIVSIHKKFGDDRFKIDRYDLEHPYYISADFTIGEDPYLLDGDEEGTEWDFLDTEDCYKIGVIINSKE